MTSYTSNGEKNDGIQKSLDDTLKHQDLRNLSFDLVELNIDELIKNETIKTLPIFKTFSAMISVGISIHDRLFLKKIVTFLFGINEISENDRASFIDKLDNSKKYRLKVAEKILYIIEKCDDSENSETISRLFKALVQKEINYEEFLALSSILVSMSGASISRFLNIYVPSPYPISISLVTEYLGTNLFYIKQDDIHVNVGPSLYDSETNASVKGSMAYAVATTLAHKLFSIFKTDEDEENMIRKVKYYVKQDLK